jgi:hypothetical protein
MINVIKYILEGLAVAMATTIISHGKTSVGEVFLLTISATAVFILLDMFAPLTAAGARHGAGFGLGFKLVGGEGEQKGGAPDMCGGGGLVQALQTAGGYQVAGGYQTGGAAAVEQKAPFNVPYKIVSSDYGAGVLVAGFNENADGYNADKLAELAPF